VTRPDRTTDRVPPLAQFVARRFATRSPWPSWVLFERLGGAVAYLFARIGVPPAAATLLSGAAGIAGATLLAVADDGAGVVGAGVALLLSYVLDCTDGQLARATHRTSAVGAWLDVSVDAVVIAFVVPSLAIILQADGATATASLLLAGAYGASRAVSLFTSTQVRSSDGGGMQLIGAAGALRTVWVGLIDTPAVYLALCGSRLASDLFRAVIVVVTVMTVTQTLVSARHHFASSVSESAA
jgi:phosphatidylglycerophosphate synthase